MAVSLVETRRRYLDAVSLDARGETKKSLAELRGLAPEAHPDLAEIVMLEAMRILSRIGDHQQAAVYARQIIAIDSDPPPSVLQVLRIAESMGAANTASDPDYVSQKPGQSMELVDGSAPNHFYAGKRRFEVEYQEEANGVWVASSEIYRARNGVLYDPANAPFEVRPQDVYTEHAEGSTPSEAFGALRSKIDNDNTK